MGSRGACAGDEGEKEMAPTASAEGGRESTVWRVVGGTVGEGRGVEGENESTVGRVVGETGGESRGLQGENESTGGRV